MSIWWCCRASRGIPGDFKRETTVSWCGGPALPGGPVLGGQTRFGCWRGCRAAALERVFPKPLLATRGGFPSPPAGAARRRAGPGLPFPAFPSAAGRGGRLRPSPPLPSPGAGAPRRGRDVGPGRRRPGLLGVSRAMANIKVAVRVRPLSKRCGGARSGGTGRSRSPRQRGRYGAAGCRWSCRRVRGRRCGVA